ncbi:Ribosomal protein S5 domain 2-type fold subgroup [Penicillium malachiteum]|uniref:Ribosomal protein S5 domain 2-type fold subgroup n=1 Tax=Penicillium malachiteum TaxID=1324776 RepID=UPI002547BA9B|nr:Ribosomal protein S5 domain 2-type fold subgroup [Penicillium malachiteum]KAJ5715166.1 Ribosomal protein S5 domain 2-type fold subgroup [Penicillium malachiteum]
MTISPLPTITLKVPAKINPQIRVGPLRQDGYHDITLAYQAISLYDTLTISHNLEGPTIHVTGMDSDRVPHDERNLVIKAANLLAAREGVEPRLHFELAKCIPSEAGLGGGSADAAAALVGCNIIWKSNLTPGELMDLGAHIGEDVPFFIEGMMAIGLGHKRPLIRLETVEYKWTWVLGVPYRGLSTKAVFQEYDRILERTSSGEEDYLIRRQGCLETSWGSCPPEELLDALENDLELPSMQLLPDIRIALEAGRSAGAIASLMSGSGSTCAFLAKSEGHAGLLKEEIQRNEVFREVMVASGPVQGVELLETGT